MLRCKTVWSACLLAIACLPAAAQDNAATWMGVPGARSERITEPVFQGPLTIYRAGKAGAEPVVLVHGLGQNGARDWARVVPVLAPNHEVIALDLPGFGQSPGGNELYSPDNYVRVIEATIAPRAGKPFTLVGHSMGAAVALAYAAAHPQRVKRLVLVDMAGVLHGSVYAESLAKFGIGQVGGSLPADAPWMEQLMRGVIGKLDKMPLDKQTVLRNPALRQQMLRGDPNLIAAFALGEHDFGAALRAVRAPTLLIWGSEDRVAPLRTGQLAAALIADSRLEVIPGAAHTPQLEDPERFNTLLLEALAGARPALKAPTRAADLAGTAQKCDGRDGARFSGDIPKLTLIQCRNVQVSQARIGELRVLESDVHLVNSEVRAGIFALRSRVQLTAGRVVGATPDGPALRLEDTEVDAAGTSFETQGPLAANDGKLPVTLRFSVAEFHGPRGVRYLHEVVRVAPESVW
ncbi:MAG TPA: alpha/beta hydrolase [Verrucomicrobiae bacterium]|nr:alpha/beta hydrolase [Verrucomicrobiae bacterium]